MGPEKSLTKYRGVIYDVGMHKGEDTQYYLKKGFRVVGFEADPELVEYCRNKFTDAIEQNRLTIIQGAIVDNGSIEAAQSKVRFYKNVNKSVWGTTKHDWASRNERFGTRNEAIEVDAVDFVESVKRYGIPYYMKIDIEGADTICLKTLSGFELKPDYISIESEKVSFEKLAEEFDLLEQLGYDRFIAVQQGDIHLQQPPDPPKEGVHTPHIFQPGSSGMFGKELPGRWQTKQEVLENYRKIFICYKLFGDESFCAKYRLGQRLVSALKRISGRAIPGWYDTHAKHSSVE